MIGASPRAGLGAPQGVPTAVAAAIAVVGSVGVGALAARSPLLAAGGLGALIAAGIVLWSPMVWLAVGLASLSAAPETLYGIADGTSIGDPQIWKLLLYAAVLPMALTRGVRSEYLVVLGAYCVATATSRLAGTPPPEITNGDTIAAVLTLMLGWAFVCVAWDWDRDQIYLKLLVVLPLLSLLVAIPLIPLGWSWFQDGSPPRLQGAQIAATLGGMSVASVSSAIILWRRAAWRPAIPLGGAAALCCVASLGRGAIIAMIMAASPAICRFLRDRWRRLSAETYLKVFLGTIAVVGAFFVFAVPALNERAENAVSYNTQTKQLEKSASSGRTEAWKNYYKQAEENLAFGRGMGSAPHIKIADGGFQSQHNEYLRLLLELGYVGGLLVLFAMIYVLVRVIRSTPAVVRPEAIMLVIALAFYSFTDNTLTARHLAVPILLTLAIAAAPSRRTPWGEPAPRAVAGPGA